MNNTALKIRSYDDRLLFISDLDGEALSYVEKGINIAFNIELDENLNIEFKEINIEMHDPSTIFIKLPIAHPNNVESLSYFPSYIQMNPKQRYLYVEWLKDISKPIDIGYVFVYYYGLERQLIMGDFEKAFNEIISLKSYHSNKSFQNYSTTALIYICLIKKKPHKLLELNQLIGQDIFRNIQFECAYHFENDLGLDNLLAIFRKIIKKAYRPLKDNRKLLKDCLEEVLIKEFGSPAFPFKRKYNIKEIGTKNEPAFANYSFPESIRFISTHDFFSFEPLVNDLNKIFEKAYKVYKIKKKQNHD